VNVTTHKKKILIIKLSALGDLFMALPHVDAILCQHPDDTVWILSDPAFENLFVHHPRMKTAVLDRKRRFGRHGLWPRIFWVRNQRFDTIFDLQGNRVSRLLVRFSASPRRVGTQPRSVYHLHPSAPYTRDTAQNVFDRLNETLASAGVLPARSGCSLYPAPKDGSIISAWKLENHLQDRRYALMHAGSSVKWPSKRWPKESFVLLARRIETCGIRCVWVGSEEDRSVNAYLSERVGTDGTGRFSLMQLYLLAKGAAFAVANDSGPMHILSAAGIPVFSFFGPTSWIRSHAAGQGGRVFFSNTACSPCYRGICTGLRGHECLEGIDPEAVFARIQQEMGLSPGREDP